jgi:hypothetical protein
LALADLGSGRECFHSRKKGGDRDHHSEANKSLQLWQKNGQKICGPMGEAQREARRPDMEDQMMSDVEFVDGFIAKAPNENAPDYVKAKVSIKREDLLNWLAKRQDEWINLEIKEGRTGRWYASVDNWKPKGASKDNDIPFD